MKIIIKKTEDPTSLVHTKGTDSLVMKGWARF